MKQLWVAVVVIVISILLLGGTAIVFYCHSSDITYSLDFGSVLDAVVFLCVGALIEYAYSKRSSDKRADTDLLLEIVREARGALDRLERETNACNPQKALTPAQSSSVTFADREFSLAVHSVEQALTHCSADLGKIEFYKLKTAWSDLKESITDTPYPGPYDPASLGHIRVSFRKMRDELTRIAFAINHR